MRLDKINFRGYQGYIVEDRIKKEEEREGLFYYHLRHPDDDWGNPCTIEDFVLVNHFGTICFKESINHLLEPWGKGRLSSDLTQKEIENIWFALQEYDNEIEHSDI